MVDSMPSPASEPGHEPAPQQPERTGAVPEGTAVPESTAVAESTADTASPEITASPEERSASRESVAEAVPAASDVAALNTATDRGAAGDTTTGEISAASGSAAPGTVTPAPLNLAEPQTAAAVIPAPPIAADTSTPTRSEPIPQPVLSTPPADARPFAPAPERPSSTEPTIAASIPVPPLVLSRSAEAGAPGGEWELLVAKVNAWLQTGELQKLWNNLRGPLKGVALLVLLAMALKVYGAVVGTIDAIPVVNGLLELIGLIALGRFSTRRLLRSKDRSVLLEDWGRRWHEFSGR